MKNHSAANKGTKKLCLLFKIVINFIVDLIGLIMHSRVCMLRSVRVGTIVDLETRDCRLRVLLIDGTSREETTGDRDESYG